ncbi:TonB family protein [Hymenobacter sp. HDW8]|uniref:TonB family protein n=1 Tax=Hymenobacter sp. HDW8 TaxID=2714932 RepID=UPI001408B1A2|nr:TonB family protein [Hymenobacter sp. HDW8]QIL74590.1 TonB family protein [Hymenobacter sp. HDW8]
MIFTKNAGLVLALLLAATVPSLAQTSTKAAPAKAQAAAPARKATPFDGLRKYMAENTRYPEQARAKGVAGTVHVRFERNDAGQIINPSIAKSLEPSCDAEAIRVIKTMPPHLLNVFPPGMSMLLPVVFPAPGTEAPKQ